MTTYVALCCHADPDGVRRWYDNFSRHADDITMVAFDASPETDGSPLAEVDLPICPYSRPLRYGNIALFHLETLRWLHEADSSFEVVVTVEADVVLLNGGLGRSTHQSLAAQDADYLGVGARRLGWDELPAGLSRRKWARWRSVLPVERPFKAFNPGQVFTRDYAEALASFPRARMLRELLARTTVFGTDEIVPPTLAHVLGLTVGWPQHSETMRPRRWPGERLLDFARAGHHLVHKVGTRADDLDRRVVEQLDQGDVEAAKRVAAADTPEHGRRPATRPRARAGRLRRATGRW